LDLVIIAVKLARKISGSMNKFRHETKSNPKNITYKKVYDLALELFSYDKDKVNSWWMSRHAELGDRSPFELVKNGKGMWLMKKLRKCK